MIIWKPAPENVTEQRAREILEIIAGALARKRDGRQSQTAQPAPGARIVNR